jgi:two-component system, OmpR family, sensor histidine kinase KdpD
MNQENRELARKQSLALKGKLRMAARILGCAALLSTTASAGHLLKLNGATAAMLLLLEIFAIGTLGDSLLALVSSAAASLVFSFFFLESSGSLRVTTFESAVTFSAMALTALTGSQLSIQAHRRMGEAIRRREEMERLNQLGRVLLAANSLPEAAGNAVRKVVELFGLKGARLRVEGVPDAFFFGELVADHVSIVPLDEESRMGVLELHGRQPSEEVRNALASMIRLVLERARSAEERAEIEATRRGEELRSTVLNALAHNFKTPLTSIKAAASILRDSENIASADERELIAVIDEEADRLNQLIRESLDLARIESHRANPRTEECRIPAIVDRVTAKMVRYFGRREFIIDIPEDLPPITGDSFLFEQMLIQVVDNAWKYSRPGSRIGISALVSGPSVVLTIRNEGSEIPDPERERIFDKFYRGSKDRSRIEGTGLGLAIARSIAEAYDGKVWLDMEPSGPAFHFALPLEATGRTRDRKPHHIAH